jgi:hypothetical protein
MRDMIGDDADAARITGDRRRSPDVVGALPDEDKKPLSGFVDCLRVSSRAQIVGHSLSLERRSDKIAGYQRKRRRRVHPSTDPIG